MRAVGYRATGGSPRSGQPSAADRAPSLSTSGRPLALHNIYDPRPTVPIPRVLTQPESPAEHCRNALTLLEVSQKPTTDAADRAGMIEAAAVRLRKAIAQLEGRDNPTGVR